MKNLQKRKDLLLKKLVDNKIMLKKYKYLTLLIFTVFCIAGINQANATLTLGSTNITTDGAFTFTSVGSSEVNMFAENTTGNITIGGSQTTGNILLAPVSGNVGIGTTSPNQQLEITQNFRIPSTTFASQYGIIYKGTIPFISDFNYGNNGTVTTAGLNTFVGTGAGNLTMGSTATGTYHASYNTAIGANSFSLNTLGYSNVAIGEEALASNTTGYRNTASGVSALTSNTTGYSNTVTGNGALYLNTTGHDNIAEGYMAGANVTGGIANATSNTSVYLGVSTKALADGDTNEIVIGYNTTGIGSNTVMLGNSSIITTALRGNVGINTTSPTGKLSITQTATATGALKGIVYTGAVNTNQTLSTEIPSLTLTTAGRQWATGALTTQREVLITQPTYSFVGASTITDAATVGIAGAPIKSTNATITNTHGLLIQAGAVSTATNSYGLTVNAQTGATSNYSAVFLGGNVGIGTTSPAQKLEVNGGIRLNTATVKSTCDSTIRGTFWAVQGATGVKDTVEVCAKDAGDAYAWRTLY